MEPREICDQGNGGEMAKLIKKFALTATNATHPTKGLDKDRMSTWTSGDGKVRKQLEYIHVSNDVRTWLNHSKTKGAANPNHENQHKIT